LAITLTQLLASRDARRDKEQQLMNQNPDKTLIVLTIVAPGNEKATPASKIAFDVAVDAIIAAFDGSIALIETHKPETGYEAFILTKTEHKEAKLKCVNIEETHPLGRLFDIDVISDGCVPMSRTEVGAEARKCLVCGEMARVCMRQRRHSVDEIIASIEKLVNGYLLRN
jgi:holo-ACP synthase